MKLPPTQIKIWTGAIEKKSITSPFSYNFSRKEATRKWIVITRTSNILLKKTSFKIFFKDRGRL
jgi:hypothetical protein